ncbi:MAG TPA: hypothetical protein VKY74_09510 [Chloroflexia bacterium]|nr:hypothetical protein [Chloroflexia bacterium]
MITLQRRAPGVLALLSLPLLLLGLSRAQADQGMTGFADPAFQQVWQRTDLPVANHTVVRTWFWGPAPNSPGLLEPNAESPGGYRLVQYFDKSRMELNNPQANPHDPFYVTNGLLTVELISGRMQVGAAQYVTRYAACIPATGDPGDTNAPTYAALQHVSNTTLGDHFADSRMGQAVTATIDHAGTVGNDPARAMATTHIAYFDSTTKHNIPQVFWTFLNQTGPVSENGTITTQQLINPWFYASGRPISEAYWTRALIRGQFTDVLLQMYERRALTYVPTNVPGFQVEMANIGQHYYDWRYRGAGGCGGTPEPSAQPTVAATETAGPPRTPAPKPSGTEPPTSTVVVPTHTPVPRPPIVTATPTLSPCEICTPVASPTPTISPCEICTPPPATATPPR